MKVSTSYSNFARAKLDHDMQGRFDLPIYYTGADVFRNFISNFKGNAIYRTGFESMVQFEDCAFIRFKFSDLQNYLMVLYENTIRFLAYDNQGVFGWVLDGSSNILEVTTPYTLQECKELHFTANDDVMYLVHPNHEPRKLTRTSANAFTFATFTRTGDPFTGTDKYPSRVLFYRGRLYYAATNEKITTVWGSEAGDYDNLDVPTTPTATSPFEITIVDIAQKIEWLFPADNSLMAGAPDGIVAINGGGVNQAIEAETIEATLTSAPGCNSAYPISKDGLVFYVTRNGRSVRYFSYDILKESFTAPDANLISYDITEGGMTKLRHRKDKNDLIYALKGNGDFLSLNFLQTDESIIGWHEHKTNGSWKDEIIITDHMGRPKLFALVERDGDYFIERQADYVEYVERVDFYTGNEANDTMAYNRYIAEQLRSCVYLDNSQCVKNVQDNLITFDPVANTITATNSVFTANDVGKQIECVTQTGYESARWEITGYTSDTVVDVEVLQTPTSNTCQNWYLTFSTISGLSQYEGKTISVVSDGGYLNDFVVEDGEISLGTQVSVAWVGYKYLGFIKTFCLGFQSGAINTQSTYKVINRVGLRLTTSAGGKIGSSLYKLEPVQELSQNDINYLPPLPIDGTKYITYSDDGKKDKYLYIAQDLPLPFNVGAVMVEASYGANP